MNDGRKTAEYRSWRAQVLWRDRACVICNSKKSPNAHHVNHATYFPELRFDVDNGVTLCYACHMNYHCQFNRSYRTKCDEYNFMNFVKLSMHFHGSWRVVYQEDSYLWPADIPAEFRDTTPNLLNSWRDAGLVAMAYTVSPDSVVGYVTELATLRSPS